MCDLPTATRGPEQSDFCWRCYQHCPQQTAVRVKAGCWVEEAGPATSHKELCQGARGSRICLKIRLAQQPGLDKGVTMPAPPPSPSCLREQRAPLSRLSLGNSHQQVSIPCLDGALSVELDERWLDPEQHFDPRTKAPSHLLGSGVGWGERFTFLSPWVWVRGSTSSFIPDPRARS